MIFKTPSVTRLFSSLSIKKKLAGIVFLASGLALLSASIAIVVLDRVAAKDTMVRNIGSLADMIASTSTAAIAFSSPEDGDEILSALSLRGDVVAAYILNADGTVFSHYPKNSTASAIPTSDITGDAQRFSGNRLHLSRSIMLNGKIIGTLVLEVSTDALDQRLGRWIKSILVVSALALLLAFLVTNRLQRIISGPISDLVHVAKRVSRTQDFSIRAVQGNNDEVGALVQSFNEMLNQIGRRDIALTEAHDTLELKVQDRTHALMQEIVEREMAEKALAAQHSYLRQIIDANPNFIFVKDRAGRFELVNRAVAEFYGTTVDALVGKSDLDFGADPEEVQAFLRDDLEVMDGGKEKFVPEERITSASGESRWLQTIKRPMTSADGTCQHLLGVSTNITARKKAEEALRASEEQLRHALKMEAIGRLAGGVAHDFNNILAVIMGRSELLMASMGKDHPLIEPVREIDAAASRAAGLTHQLLAFSRRQVLESKPLNLNACVENMKSMLQRLIGEDVHVNTILDPAAGTVYADRGQIEQVIMNLIVNARDAMPNGGTLTIRTGNEIVNSDHKLTLSGVTPGVYVFLSVADTGHGMDEATSSQIFEPFFTTKATGKGTGLGLSTVYGIVKQSSGHIVVKSVPGSGTTFTILLPLTEGMAISPVQPEPHSERPAGRGQTILVIEDEEGVRNLVEQILTMAGYNVLVAAHGVAALDIAREGRRMIDLVITDVIMPGLNGPEVVAILQEKRPNLRIIYMSGHADLGVVDAKIFGAGHPLLQKPFRLEALRDLVKKTLAEAEVAQT